MVLKSHHTILIYLIVIVLVGTFYFFVNPYEVALPKCPLYSWTGIKCPGCGSQRALHFLFNFELKKAFDENPLMLISIPYLLLSLYFRNPNVIKKYPETRDFFFGAMATKVVLFLVLGFAILRNF